MDAEPAGGDGGAGGAGGAGVTKTNKRKQYKAQGQKQDTPSGSSRLRRSTAGTPQYDDDIDSKAYADAQ